MASLIEGGDLVEDSYGSSEDGTIEGIYGSVVLAVDAQVWVELRLFDDDIGQSTFAILSADADVEVALQCADGRVGQRDRFTTLRRDRLSDIQPPTSVRRGDTGQSGDYNDRETISVERGCAIHRCLLDQGLRKEHTIISWMVHAYG